MTVRMAIAVGLGALLLAVPNARAATKAERQRAASEMVQVALRSEIEGENSQRSQSLQSALEQVPDFAPAKWHSGHVQHQNQWVKFDALPELISEDRRLVAYRRLREKSPETVAGQLELARWCVKSKLADRARAHLTRVLELDPEQAEARRLLGYRNVDGVWLSEQEVREAAVRAAEMEAGLRKWGPEIEKILQGLTHRAQRQRELARERLLAIDDPAAVPALEFVLSRHSEDVALMMIQVLGKLEASEAAVALARQAVFSGWERVREAAAEKLQPRDPATYVPMLLSAMVTPVQTRAELYRAPNGRLTYRHTLYREGQEQGQLAVFETEYRRALLSPADPASWDERRQQLHLARRQDAAIKAQALEAAVAQQNAMIQRVNERICWVLSKATGQDLPAAPETWWKWWNEYNEVYVSGDKAVRTAYRRDTVQFDDPMADVPVRVEPPKPAEPAEPLDGDEPFPGGTLEYSNAPGYEQWKYEGDTYRKLPTGVWAATYDGRQWVRPAGGTWTRLSCLLAGTLVWTDSGLVPIEEIQVGDLVLSQNPGTGELAYKPVLKTTLRPPVGLLKIVFGGKALQCSGGHPFWIAGKGWVFARDLEEGMPLHTVDGTIEVRSVHSTGIERLHNLVVADFHTYFVTEAKILTHDNTIREPTNVVVPGLASR